MAKNSDKFGKCSTGRDRNMFEKGQVNFMNLKLNIIQTMFKQIMKTIFGEHLLILGGNGTPMKISPGSLLLFGIISTADEHKAFSRCGKRGSSNL